MVEPSSFYIRLATREAFNASVRHIQGTLEALDRCSVKQNLADEINNLVISKDLDPEAVASAAYMLLVEKFRYRVVSRNLTNIPSDPNSVVQTVSKWKAMDLVVGYHHPDMGFLVVNPKNPDAVSVLSGLRKNELIVLFAGIPNTDFNTALADTAAETLLHLLENRKTAVPTTLLSGSCIFIPAKKPTEKKVARLKEKKASVRSSSGTSKPAGKPAVAASSASSHFARQETAVAAAPVPGRTKMSGLVSVPVSNELFHNGNVEAWKRIIRSFNAKYPNLQVFIYYDGERIVDINTLFKWGKVKHGSCIQFCVAGENIQDLAKLSRYFRQGASPQFEAFLHGSPDTVMNLF